MSVWRQSMFKSLSSPIVLEVSTEDRQAGGDSLVNGVEGQLRDVGCGVQFLKQLTHTSLLVFSFLDNSSFHRDHLRSSFMSEIYLIILYSSKITDMTWQQQ